MNIFADFQRRVAALLEEVIAAGGLPPIDLARFVVEPPREASHGDLSTNAAMVYAKEAKAAGSNARALAVEIAAGLAEEDGVDQAEVAGPGFINIRLKPVVYQNVLRAVLKDGLRFGALPIAGEKANVEYVSANPTGPMHVGHARGAVFGDALANLLDFAGQPVVREFYINDAGAQVDTLARSAYLRYREALATTSERFPKGSIPAPISSPSAAWRAE